MNTVLIAIVVFVISFFSAPAKAFDDGGINNFCTKAGALANTMSLVKHQAHKPNMKAPIVFTNQLMGYMWKGSTDNYQLPPIVYGKLIKEECLNDYSRYLEMYGTEA